MINEIYPEIDYEKVFLILDAFDETGTQNKSQFVKKLNKFASQNPNTIILMKWEEDELNDLVSIIMPSYNTGRFIKETIESVLAQSYPTWELIIVDDCSTDNTDEVVNQYLADERIRYIKNDTNSGAAVSRNRALREAKGKWIAFLDSDDLWEADKLQKQIIFMIIVI